MLPVSGTRVDSAPARRNTFPRNRRLKRRKLIQSLFDRSSQDTSSIKRGPIKLLYRRVEASTTGTSSPLQIGFAIGRSLGGAVERNRIKRALRETFRKHRLVLERDVAVESSTLIVMVLLRGTGAARTNARLETIARQFETALTDLRRA